MLQIYTENGYIPIETRQEYYYLQNYNGFNELYFDVSVKDMAMKHLKNEAIILNEDNRFLIKDINRRTQNATIECELDLDEWKHTVFFDTANDARFQTKTIGEVFDVIKPEGWKINNTTVRTIRRTVELQDAQPYDIMMEIQKVYSVVYDIDVINKTVNLINPDMYTFNGLYATPELNMKGVTWQGNSDDFCTRLFAYGKIDDNGIPISIRSVNNGKEYVENYTYSDKVITKVWRDERYTDPQNLYDDVVKKLNELSVPRMSYDVSIVDLQKMNEEYNFLAFGLYEIVKTIIDENTFIEQKVVTYKRYYDKPDKNVITLSNEKQTFTSKVSSVLGGSPNEILDGSFLDQAKQESANIINAFATKGHRYETENETYFLDKLPKEEAKYVMRMNLGGIAFSTSGWAGPYNTAWTIDGKFNADFISTGTLQAIKIKGSEIIGGSIDIGNGTFVVDKNGNLKMTRGTINIGNRFKVDQYGNVEISGNGYFKGNIEGSNISGGNITGSTINTNNDINVGNNIYLSKASVGKIKGIFLDNQNYLSFNGNNQLLLRSNDTVSIMGGDPSYTNPTGTITANSIATSIQWVKIGSSPQSVSVMKDQIIASSQIKVSSDVRLKENFEDIDLSGLFKYIDVKKFNYINNDKKTVGVIAQDFIGTEYEDIILSMDENGYYSVNYSVIYLAIAQYISKQIRKVIKNDNNNNE